MEQDNPSYVVKMLDEFRSANKLSLRPPTGSRLSGAFPLSNTPIFGPADKELMPFDDSLLNRNDFLIRKKRKLPFEDSIGSDVSLDDSMVPASPWDIRRMKSDLAEAKAEISSLETRITQLHNLRKETELLFEKEKGSLLQNIERDRNTIKDLENRIKVLRRREEKLKDELVDMVTASSKEKLMVKNKSSELQTENMNLKLKIGQIEDKNTELSRELNSAKTEVQTLQSELGSVRAQCQSLSTQLSELKAVSRQYDTDKAVFTAAQHTINKLENEIKAQMDIADVVKSQHAKLTRYANLEKQLNSLIKENNRLRDTTSNSIYLEGIVEDLRGRLKTLDEREAELVELRVELGVAQAQLADYAALAHKVLGADAAPPAAGAPALANYLRELHSANLLAKSHQTQLQAKLKSLEEAHKGSTNECSKLKAEIENIKQELEQNAANVRRLKKQNALITWERNDLRSLVDSCQREVTMSGGSIPVEGGLPSSLMEQKVETLEKLVDNYRKRVQELESDPSLAQGLCFGSESSPTGSTGLSVSSVATAEAQLETLKKEKAELLEKVESLQYEIDHRALKGDFNTQNTKIIHLKMNPIMEGETKRTDELEKCKAEILKLRERVRILQEAGAAASSAAVNITQTVESNIELMATKEVEELREKAKSQELQNQRLREAFKKTMQEFREAIYALLGYKINGLPNKMYKLSPLYAESPDHYLTFKISQNGDMELIETEFSSRVSDLIEVHLCQNHSIPVFLSAVTMDLFQRRSESILSDVSVQM